MTSAPRQPAHPRRSRRAFTLVEIGLVLIIIAVLASILLVGLSRAIRGVRIDAERQYLRSVVLAAVKFKDDFGFPVPLIQDTAPGPINGSDDPVVRSKAFLQDPESNGGGVLYSEFSIPYYILGAADKDVDGIDGLGYTKPLAPAQSGAQWVGAFSRRGQKYEPTVDLARGNNRVVRDPANLARIVRVVDRWNNPFRYYRWEKTYFTSGARKDEIDDPGIAVGAFTPDVWKQIIADPSQYLPLNNPANRKKARQLAMSIAPELRAAEFAVVSSGPDGRFNDAPTNVTEAKENLDNIVEVSR